MLALGMKMEIMQVCSSIPVKHSPDLCSMSVPRWLSDEAVHSGIKAQLLVDRCLEEIKRLSQERCTMQVWCQEEWASLQYAMASASKSILSLLCT